MSGGFLVIATRSDHKLREIEDILLPAFDTLRLLDLNAAGLPYAPDEDTIEVYDSFEENALAKARYYHERLRLPVLADDSGLCVDALNGAPGVRSKRFSGTALSGLALDRANNERLLEALREVPDDERTAHYRCVIALASDDTPGSVFVGSVDGLILKAGRGTAGFGYDPLFFVPSLGATFAEVPQETKNRISHRARALEAALPALERIAANPLPERGKTPAGG